MTVLIVSSSEDPASTNIKNSLLQQACWQDIGLFSGVEVYRHLSMKDIILVTIPDKKIFHENIDREVQEQLNVAPKIAIFLSRHRSKMEEPTLTVHPIGNYADAQFGGLSKTLVPAAPRMMTNLLRLMKKNLETTDLLYQICYEVTHHGPFLKIPTLFAEVGSTEEHWRRPEPAAVIATSLLELLASYHYEEQYPKDLPVLVGIGGGHYAPRFTDIALQKNVAFGHMIPSYHIETGAITDDIIENTLKATPDVKGCYLHRKALKKSQITQFKKIFQEKQIPVLSSKEMVDL